MFTNIMFVFNHPQMRKMVAHAIRNLKKTLGDGWNPGCHCLSTIAMEWSRKAHAHDHLVTILDMSQNQKETFVFGPARFLWYLPNLHPFSAGYGRVWFWYLSPYKTFWVNGVWFLLGIYHMTVPAGGVEIRRSNRVVAASFLQRRRS
jgi:hypothetical protein